MKILKLNRRGERATAGPVLAILVLVIGAIMLWKIYRLAEHLLPPPPPPPPPPTSTNSVPPTNFPATNCDAGWIVIPDTNAPNVDPYDVIYGLMPPANPTGLLNSTPIPVMTGGAFESAGGPMLDTSNVVALIQEYYGVNNYQPNTHCEWVYDPDANLWNWTILPATNISYDRSSGLITVGEWTANDSPRTVILQRSTNLAEGYTNLWTNTMRAGQFYLYQDTKAGANQGFYRTALPQ